MSNRLDNTRVVTFKENYPKTGKTIYAEGSTHPIHHETVAKLQAKKVKMEVEKFDEKGEIAKAKKALEESKKVD